MVEKRTLRELIARKMIDYGYRSIWEMTRSTGLHPCRIYEPLAGQSEIGLKARQWIVRELDVNADVLEVVIRNDRLSKRGLHGRDGEIPGQAL